MKINGLYFGEVEPTTTIGGCIDIFEGIWANPEETIDAIESECSDSDSGVKWERATTVGRGVKQNQRTNYHLGISTLAENTNSNIAKDIHNQFYSILLSTTIPYSRKHDIDELYYSEGFNMLRYQGGQEYKAHYDGNTGTGRSVSVICYLNDDYEGGEVEFVNFGLKVKPKKGMLLIFPSNYAYTHIAHPVTSGTKYALVTWIHDRLV